MKAIIDSSSFIQLARCYIPLDKSNQLKELIKKKFEQGDIIIIDKVFDECRQFSKGIAINKLEFLSNKKLHIKTVALFPNDAFFKQLKHNFLNQDVIRLKKLTDVEIEASKNEFLEDADGKILIYAQSITSESPIIVTEESRSLNDKKEIKKIPLNCDCLNIDCCDLPTLLSNHYNLEFTFK